MLYYLLTILHVKVNGFNHFRREVYLMKKRYTQQELADELGVSRATIDRVIHNRGGISEKTVNVVKKRLKEVNYNADLIGRTLAKRDFQTVYVLTFANNFFAEDAIAGFKTAEEEYSRYGVHLEFMRSHYDTDLQIKQMEQAIEDKASGIILCSHEPEKMKDIIDKCTALSIPVITFNNDVPSSSRLCFVGGDYIEAGLLAGELIRKLIRAGTVAHVHTFQNFWQTQRLSGFLKAMEGVPEVSVVESRLESPTYRVAYNEIKYLLEQYQDLQGLVVQISTEEQANGTFDAIKNHSSKHIHVLTFDLASFITQYLADDYITACVCQDPFSQGYCSAKLMFRYLLTGVLPERVLYKIRYEAVFASNHQNYGREFYNLLR